jgi:urease accessory protein UreE
VNLLPPLGAGLRDGDVVFEDRSRRIVIRVCPAEVYVARPPDLRTMGVLAAELGNLHLPLEIAANELLTPRDGPAAGVLARCDVPFTIERRIFHPLRTIALTDVAISPALTLTRRR